MEQNINQQQDHEQDLFEDNVQYTTASQGQRFLNWLIDNILLRLFVQYVTLEMFIRLMLKIAPEYTIRVFSREGFESYLITYLFVIFHYIFYYAICETAFKGRTIGKLITGTRAIRNTGEDLTIKDALLRSLSRRCRLKFLAGLVLSHGMITGQKQRW